MWLSDYAIQHSMTLNLFLKYPGLKLLENKETQPVNQPITRNNQPQMSSNNNNQNNNSILAKMSIIVLILTLALISTVVIIKITTNYSKLPHISSSTESREPTQ